MTNNTERISTFISQRRSTSVKGPLLMLAAALIFAVLDGLIKSMGPAFRVWDIAFLRWGGSLALLVVIFGRQGTLLMNQGFKYCKSWEGGMYLTAEMVFTAILGIVFLGELTSWHFWAGGILILLSVISLQLITARQIIRT